MAIEAAIEARLLAVSAVTDMVAKRIYPVNAPQLAGNQGKGAPARPYVTYGLVSGDAGLALQGTTGLNRDQVQLKIWGNTSSDVKALFYALRTALHGYKGTSAGTKVLLLKCAQGGDDYVPPVDGSEVGAKECVLDFLAVWLDS